MSLGLMVCIFWSVNINLRWAGNLFLVWNFSVEQLLFQWKYIFYMAWSDILILKLLWQKSWSMNLLNIWVSYIPFGAPCKPLPHVYSHAASLKPASAPCPFTPLDWPPNPATRPPYRQFVSRVGRKQFLEMIGLMIEQIIVCSAEWLI